MAEVRTIVRLDRTEMIDALVEKARSQLDKCIGGAELVWCFLPDVSEPNGVEVSFCGKVRT